MRHFFLEKKKNFKLSLNVIAFNLFPKLRGRLEYQLYSGTKYVNVILCDSHQHYIDIETIQSFLDNPGGPQWNAIKYKFITWIWSLFGLQMSSHILYHTSKDGCCPLCPICPICSKCSNMSNMFKIFIIFNCPICLKFLNCPNVLDVFVIYKS